MAGILDKRIDVAKRPGKWGAIEALTDKVNDIELYSLAANDTTNINAGADVAFDTEEVNPAAADKRFTLAAGVVTLPAGGVFEVELKLTTSGTTAADIQYGVHNGTAIVGLEGEGQGSASLATGTSDGVAKAVISTVAGAVSITARIVAETAVTGILAAGSYLLVKRLA